jgi:hypothetical protein
MAGTKIAVFNLMKEARYAKSEAVSSSYPI